MRGAVLQPAGFGSTLWGVGLGAFQGSGAAGGAMPLVQHRWGCGLYLSRSKQIAARGVPENPFVAMGRNPRQTVVGRSRIGCTGKGLISGTASESGPSG